LKNLTRDGLSKFLPTPIVDHCGAAGVAKTKHATGTLINNEVFCRASDSIFIQTKFTPEYWACQQCSRHNFIAKEFRLKDLRDDFVATLQQSHNLRLSASSPFWD
jgi:hypothetical protein